MGEDNLVVTREIPWPRDRGGRTAGGQLLSAVRELMRCAGEGSTLTGRTLEDVGFRRLPERDTVQVTFYFR